MSLVTSTAFQNIPAIQTRSFVALAALANQDVDDDFLYQILVAFRAALVQADENHANTVISMLRCICRIIPILQSNSRYLSSAFWLAVSLLQSSCSAFYMEATILLRVSLEAMEEQDMFRDKSVEVALLEGRLPLEEITEQLDRLLKFSFESSFSFTLAAIIFKGMRLRHFKEYAEAALRTLLRVTVRAERDPDVSRGFKCSPSSSVLGYFLALLPASTTPESYRNLLRECDIGDAWHADAGLPEVDQQTNVPRITQSFLSINDPQTALFVATFVGTMLSTSQGDDAESEMLYSLLADLGYAFPETVSLV
jgi:neurofibromin 1